MQTLKKTISRAVSDTSASSAGLASFGIGFIFISFVLLICGWAVDWITFAHNYIIHIPSLPVSQERIVAFDTLIKFFTSAGFIYFFAAGINYLVVSMRETPGEV